MKRFKDHPKNKHATIENDLVYTAKIEGVTIYKGYGHEMPNESLFVIYPELVESTSPLADSILESAIRLQRNIFIVEKESNDV